MNSLKTYEIRDPIHGFIVLNDWERDIVNHPIFQRLRRIKQLSLTDMVYPGAMHTRFEHSLGVMHIATLMYNEILKRRVDFLKSELSFSDDGLNRDRIIVRLSCLLHDIGHAPFSHASEELMDKDEKEKPYKHENYSAAAALLLMQDVIENHPVNQNLKIKAQEIADFLNGRSTLGRSLLWRNLLSSQLDADRADYLLRDSHHCGVAYGKYDLNRLLVTLTVTIDPEINSSVIAVEEGGEHAAEALIIARYMMFTQVYFQHTRRAYDHHIVQTLQYLLEQYRNSSVFPQPTSKNSVEEYFKWDDWFVFGKIHANEAGEDGKKLIDRKHHRCVFQTPEIPNPSDLDYAGQILNSLKDIPYFIDKAESSWYKPGPNDIQVLLRPGKKGEILIPLSTLSPVVKGLKNISQTRVYVPFERKKEADLIVSNIKKN